MSARSTDADDRDSNSVRAAAPPRARGGRRNVTLPERLLDVRDAAELLGVEESTIRQWTYQRRIPVVHPDDGRAARYRLTVLLDLIEQWERPARGRAPGATRWPPQTQALLT